MGAVVSAIASPIAWRLSGWSRGAALSQVRLARRLVPAAAIAVALAVVGGRIGWHTALPAYVAFAIVAVALGIVDVVAHRLPDRLTLPSYPLGIALLAVAAASDGDWTRWLRALAGAGALFGCYLVLHLVSPRDLGRGDVKYAGVIGLHLGWLGWSTLAVGAISAFLVGGLASLALLVVRRVGLRTRLAFGPSMIAGAFLAIALGPAINDGLLIWTS